MRDKLLTYLRKNQRSTFSEIENLFEREGIEYHGESSIELRAGANIMLWDGWNHSTVDLILELVHSGQIVFAVADWIEQMCFGKMFMLPIAKRPEHDYKRLHWLPVVVSLAEMTQ